LPGKPALTACLDANVIISGVAYGGIPLEILKRLYSREFTHVTGPNILEEVQRVLINKMGQDESKVDGLVNRLKNFSTRCVPMGKIKPIHYQPDNLVLEVAVIGECDVLVTGDKNHLLPLNPYQDLIIESPAHFLKRLKTVNDPRLKARASGYGFKPDLVGPKKPT
jgi:putative PIN family toxin of toxin-antitoxin system